MYRHLRLSWSQVGIAVLVAICVFPVLALDVMQRPPIYEARSLILFALGREYVFVPDEAGMGGKAPNPGDFQGVVNAEMLLLDNPDLSQTALEKVGVERVYPGIPDTEDNFQQAVLWFQASTLVELITGSYVVKVAVRHPEPEIAAELTNALTAAFLERRQKLYAGRETTALQIRLHAANSQAEEVNQEVSTMLRGLDPQVVSAEFENTAQDQANLARLLRETKTRLAALQARRDVLQTRLGTEAELNSTNIDIREEEARVNYLETSMEENLQKVQRLSALMPQLRPLIALQQKQAERIGELRLRLRDSEALNEAAVEGNVRVIEEAVPPLRSSSTPLKVQLMITSVVALLAGIAVSGLISLVRIGKKADEAEPEPQQRVRDGRQRELKPTTAPIATRRSHHTGTVP